MPKGLQSRSGLLPFTLAMIASILSISGTLMTQFAVITWAWQSTRSTIASGLITVTSFSAVVLVSIVSGALIDRWNRKRTIIITDIIGGLTSGAILLLHITNALQVWHLAMLGIVLGTLEAFQFPAYLASITQMVVQEQRNRANGMFQTSWSVAEIVSAALAGILFALVGLNGVLLIDIASFGIIIVTISLIHIPQPEDGTHEQTSLVQDIVEGFRYLFTRPSVLFTALLFTSINVAYGTYQGIFRPMILVFTNNNEQFLGYTLAAVGIGSVVGGIIMSVWKGPKKRMPTILLSWSVMSIFGFVIAGLGRSLIVWLIGRFMAGVISTVAVALCFGVWQDNVEENVQGRVFSIIRLLAQGSIPIAAFVATLLVDKYVGPAMQNGHLLANSLGSLFGTGIGAAMSLVMVFAGIIFGIVLPLCGFLIPAVRDADDRRLPDSHHLDTLESVASTLPEEGVQV